MVGACSPARRTTPLRTPSPCRTPWPLLAWLAAALAWRAPGFCFSEVNWDEHLYLLIADTVAQGQLPYAALWDRKPAGLFFLLAGVEAADPSGFAALRLLPALGIGLTAWCLADLTRCLAPGARLGGWVAGWLWIAYAGRADGGGLNTELLFVPLNLLGARMLFALPSPRRLFGAGLLLGTALQMKYNAGFIWLALPVIWAMRRHRAPGMAALAAAGIGAALPSLLVIGPFIAAGRFDLWWEANVAANLGIVQSLATSQVAVITGDPVYMIGRYAVPLFGGLLALTAIRLGAPWERVAMMAVCLALTLSDAIALLVLGRFTDHMMIQLLPGPCLAAGCLAAWLERRRLMGAAGLVLLLGCAAARDGRGFLDPFVAAAEILERRGAGAAQWGDPVATAAARIATELRPGDALYVFGGPILGLYGALHRAPPTRFPFAEHLWKPYAPPGGEAEMRRILAAGPAIIAVSAGWQPGQPAPEPAAAAVFATLHRALATGYAPIATISPFTSRRGGPIGPRESIVIFRRLASPMAED